MQRNNNNTSYWHVMCNDILKASCYFSNRFENDKLFYEDEHKLLIIDGILLNKQELFDRFRVESLNQLLSLVLEDILLARFFIGPFTLFLYDKTKKKGYACGNQTGDASVFYEIEKGRIIGISNNFKYLADNATKKNLDERSAHYLLTYGFIVGNGTIIESIKRLTAGEYLQITDSGYDIKRYHRFDFSNKINVSIEQACEELDQLFRQAVKRCFDKDIEYGYDRHLADISAGLDSRMTNWVAKDLGYKNITNISYSQSKSDEERLVNGLMKSLGNQFYYHPLDDVSFLYHIDDIVEQEFGFAYYCGITGGWDFLNFIDFNRFGLEHTGQIGDAVISTVVKNPSSNKIDYNIKRNSYLLNLRYKDSINRDDYKTQEEFVFYTRVTQGALSTHYIRSNYTYAVSPFMDIELLEYCEKLPDELRENHRLYWYWIEKKYPEAGRIPSSRINERKIINKYVFLFKRCVSKTCRIVKSFLYSIGLSKTRATRNNMNPHTYWVETNEDLCLFINRQYTDNKSVITDYPMLGEEVHKMIVSSNGLDKLMAISLLATIKRFCN